MLKATVLKVFRKTNNVIYGYRLQDESGNIKDVTPEQLKNAIKCGLIHLNNYKLTSDNRIIKVSNLYIKSNTIKETSISKQGIQSQTGINPKRHERNKTVQDGLYEYRHGGDKPVKKVTVIFEDSTSGNEILRKIVEYFSIKERLNIKCTYKYACGCANIPKILDTCQVDDNNKCIVVFDRGVSISEQATLMFIADKIASKNTRGINCITFEPFCIEECALTFKCLASEIKGLSETERDLLSDINNFFTTGIDTDYIRYDSSKSQYTYGNLANFKFRNLKSSKTYRVLNKTLNSPERVLAAILLNLTCDRPYYFNKKSSVCWLSNCLSATGTCALDTTGKNPNSPSHMCNKTLMEESKIEQIINNSMFGIMYEILEELLLGRTNAVGRTLNINNNVYDQKTGRYQNVISLQ